MGKQAIVEIYASISLNARTDLGDRVAVLVRG